MKKKKILYVGAFLEDRSLLTHAIWPIHQEEKAEHVTLAFKPGDDHPALELIGSETTVRVVGHSSDSKGQAALVEVDVHCDNAHPHVTLSVAEGVAPSYSNQLLAVGEVTHIPPLSLRARIGARLTDGSIWYGEEA